MRKGRVAVLFGELSAAFWNRHRLSPDGPDESSHCNPQYATAVVAYRCATRTRSSIETHSLSVWAPPAEGPWVMPGTLASAQNVLQSSQNGFAPNGRSGPDVARYDSRNALTSASSRSSRKPSRTI